MKRSITKKLNLTKETISDLNAGDMNLVKGGYITASCNTECSCDTDCIFCTEPIRLCV